MNSIEPKKIAMLVSGGVDSAVALDLLVRQGHDITLFYIRIGRDDDSGDCNADEEIEICNLLARKYSLPLKVVELHEEYWSHVMSYALQTVKEGRTPHPDMMCNKIIKFGFFEKRWGKDYDFTATGHYASIVEKDGLKWLGTAVDPVKDQTDFLAQLSYEQLSHIMFPLGGYTKEEVRNMAREAKLPNASRKDSQGICFLGKIDYAEFLKRHLGEQPGAVVEIETGKKIGEHRGYWFYTIGQRKGLGLSGGPWFVVRKNLRTNTIYVSNGYHKHKQYGKLITLAEPNWITKAPNLVTPVAISFKNRHTPHFADATLTQSADGHLLVESAEPIQGIAPGQFGIIYTPDRKICLGSGIICENPN